MSSERNIAVCPNCENPLIATLAFAGAEWFCWECRWRGSMFNSKDIDSTPELVKKLKSDTSKFDEIRDDLWLGGECIIGCKKCKERKERHAHHLTKREKERSERARAMVGIKI